VQKSSAHLQSKVTRVYSRGRVYTEGGQCSIYQMVATELTTIWCYYPKKKTQVPTKPWKSDLSYIYKWLQLLPAMSLQHIPDKDIIAMVHSTLKIHCRPKLPSAPPISNQVSQFCFHTLSCNVITTLLQYSRKSKSQFTCTNKVLYLL